MSRSLSAATACSTISAFSCDIVYSDSPHGFEGLRVIPKQFQVEVLALSNRRDRREFGPISWPLAPAAGDVPFDDAVSRVDPADRLYHQGVPGIAKLLHPLHDRFATEERPWLRPVLHRSH